MSRCAKYQFRFSIRQNRSLSMLVFGFYCTCCFAANLLRSWPESHGRVRESSVRANASYGSVASINKLIFLWYSAIAILLKHYLFTTVTVHFFAPLFELACNLQFEQTTLIGTGLTGDGPEE